VNIEEFSPRIATFLCSWCSYGAADMAGVGRMSYPADFRVVRIPCTGRLSPKFVLSALRQGADGIWVSGCHPGDCHFISGNLTVRRHFTLLKNLLEYVGVEPGRLHFSWISSAEADKFARVAKDVAAAVRSLGPAQNTLSALIKAV